MGSQGPIDCGFPVPPEKLVTGHEFVFPDYVDVAQWQMACGTALGNIQAILSDGPMSIPDFFAEWDARELPEHEGRLGRMMLGWSGQGASQYGRPEFWGGGGDGELRAMIDDSDEGGGCLIGRHRGDPYYKRMGGTSGEL